ncbi:MAG: precorrin-2 C(20)-methyltransferase [Huintestinicola sp.]
MSGKLYGVSVGPGDPSLMTLKAVHILNNCRVVAVPRTAGDKTLALSIAEKNCCFDDKEILYLDFLMTSDKEKLRESHRKSADTMADYLKRGEDVAFITIGDISIYSTFYYLADHITDMGFETEICAGVPSFCAAAAEIKQPIVIGSESLAILPYGCSNFSEICELASVKVIMKSGRNIRQLKKDIGDRQIYAVENCGLENQRIYNEIPEESGYFTTIIVK